MGLQNTHNILRKRLLLKAGVEVEKLGDKYTVDDIERLQWSTDFERKMKNRLNMGAIRYGLHNAPGKKAYDRVESIKRRADAFALTGNTEHLVDIANEALCEYVEEIHPHPNKHFTAQDDSSHTKQKD